MEKFRRKVWILLIVTLIVGSVPATGLAETTSGKDKGMWAWFPNEDINTEKARQDLVEFSKEKGINVIYLNIGVREDVPQVPPFPYRHMHPKFGVGKQEGIPYLQLHPKQYQKFIKLAHENDIEVIALDGNSEWAKEKNHKTPIKRMIQVAKYNKFSKEEEQFDGIQMDIEPYLLDEWETEERSQLIQDYLNGLNKLDRIAAAHNMDFMIAMPFWFDGDEYVSDYNNVTKPLSDHAMDTVDTVAIMAYRDSAEGKDSMMYHSEHELEYADENGKTAVIAVETQNLEGIVEPYYEKVSYFEEGEAYMNDNLEIVDAAYADHPGYGGQAIHKYQSYRSMKP
ncbi:alpha-amylase family protein [Salibacterium sp. K-3]